MKCPDCGFECLPDDVECLACGVNIASAVENKEKERIRSIEAAERKAKYDIELKKELGLISENDPEPVAPVKGETLEDTFRKKPVCPKCGAPRHPEATDCLRCGIIFYKMAGGNGTPQPLQKSFVPPESDESQRMLKRQALPDVAPAEQNFETPYDDERTEEIDLADLKMETRTETAQPAADVMEKRKAEPEIPVRETVRTSAPVRKRPVPRPVMKEEPGLMSFFEKITDSLKRVYESGFTGIKRLAAGRSLEKHFNRKVFSIFLVVVVVALLSPFIYSAYTKIMINHRKHLEDIRMKEIQVDFVTHRDAVNGAIRNAVDQKRFSDAEHEIGKYDIPALKSDMLPLKNYLMEARINEEIKRIPENDYERNYQAYADLVKVNGNNPDYISQMNLFREKLADSEYAMAGKYITSNDKSLTYLSDCLKTIDKAIALMGDTGKYHDMKNSLLREKLLFPTGNSKIVMAVRDDGMGGKLFAGQRKLTVWIRNISSEVVYINIQYISMIGKDNVKYTYNDVGDAFKSNLAPGEQTRGELYFKTGESPAKVVFNHLVCGEISRSFP